MIESNPTLLILAGGLGSRYGNLKQIDEIGPCGERIIDYSVYDAIQAGFKKVIYVIRQNFEEEFIEHIINRLPPDIKTGYVFQKMDSFTNNLDISEERTKPWGTGHALLSAQDVINEPFVVINADDFYGAESYKIAYEFLTSQGDPSHYALIGFKLKNTLSDYGTVSRAICEIDKENNITSIVERTEIKRENNIISYKNNGRWIELLGTETVSMNMFAFYPSIFEKCKNSFNSFLIEKRNDLQSEFYIPTALNEIIKNRENKIKVLETSSTWFGLTYKEDKKIVIKKILELIENQKYPRKLW